MCLHKYVDGWVEGKVLGHIMHVVTGDGRLVTWLVGTAAVLPARYGSMAGC